MSTGRFVLLIVLGVAAYLLLMTQPFGHSAANVRLDCGDVRFTFHETPMGEMKMPEPERTRLLDMARKLGIPENKWAQIHDEFDTFSREHNVAARFQSYWRALALWIEEDPAVAEMLFPDVVNWTRHAQSKGGLPNSCWVLDALTIAKSQGRDWKADSILLDVLNDPEQKSPLYDYLRTRLGITAQPEAAPDGHSEK